VERATAVFRSMSSEVKPGPIRRQARRAGAGSVGSTLPVPTGLAAPTRAEKPCVLRMTAGSTAGGEFKKIAWTESDGRGRGPTTRARGYCTFQMWFGAASTAALRRRLPLPLSGRARFAFVF